VDTSRAGEAVVVTTQGIDWTRLDGIVLKHGAHNRPEDGVCLLEAICWLAGEVKFSDSPECVCPLIASFGRRANDRFRDDERQLLKSVAPLMVGTTGSLALLKRRAFRCADWAVREMAPVALEARGFKEKGALLRGLVPITDRETALKARDVAREARRIAYAAYAAYAAAAYADADYAAAADAAADAAYAAAYAAKRKAIRRRIVDSTIALIRELCEMQEDVEA
jgi:hypothetical protein